MKNKHFKDIYFLKGLSYTAFINEIQFNLKDVNRQTIKILMHRLMSDQLDTFKVLYSKYSDQIIEESRLLIPEPPMNFKVIDKYYFPPITLYDLIFIISSLPYVTKEIMNELLKVYVDNLMIDAENKLNDNILFIVSLCQKKRQEILTP